MELDGYMPAEIHPAKIEPTLEMNHSGYTNIKKYKEMRIILIFEELPSYIPKCL